MDTRESRYLIQRAGAGDREALDQLFGAALPRLRVLLQMRSKSALRRRADIDDLVQEAYMEAMRSFHQYAWQGHDSFFRWLASVAINRSRNLERVERAEKRDVAREVPFAGPATFAIQGGVTDAIDPAPGPRTMTAGAETDDRLQLAFASLSDVDREVIMLARVEGLPLKLVAERMGRTRNATALLLSRALRKLKEQMDRSTEPS